MKINAVMSLSGWDEKDEIGEKEGVRVTSVKSGFSYEGDMIGESSVRYLLQYNTDGTGDFIGWEEFRGIIGGKKGSLVLKHIGQFVQHGIESSIDTVPLSGGGELAGINLKSDQKLSGQGPYMVEFYLEDPSRQ